MPASLFHIDSTDPTSSPGCLEDQRALQLAFELSMLGLSSDSDPLSGSFDTDSRGKKSQNTTECVPVPSSEHVAEIVGRQGCKIKALRAKTNTYIKTPVRGEEPVFVVTGRKEDVGSAKREILSAAEHFSQIRAQRKSNLTLGGPGPNANIPGQTTIQVRVPYRVVGLVVGPKGATIKRIQQQTNTYIITPSRDKEPIFEVSGLPDSVETAKKEIEAHIAMRTGGVIESNGDSDGTDSSGLNDPFASDNRSPTSFGSFPGYLYDNGLGSYETSNSTFTSSTTATNRPGDSNRSREIFNFGLTSSKFNDLYSSFGSFNGKSSFSTGLYESDKELGESPTFTDLTTTNVSSSEWPDFTSAKIFAAVPNLERRSSSLGSEANSTASSSAGSSSGGNTVSSSSPAETTDTIDGTLTTRRLSSNTLASAFAAATQTSTATSIAFSGLSGSTTTSSSPTESLGSLGSLNGGGSGARKNGQKRDCIVCFEGEIQAALIPCGHNLFCMDCALRVCRKSEANCPVCHQHANQAIRIIS